METTLLNRVTNNPAVLAGKPVIRGMRLSVEHILKMLARGISHKDIIEEYPFLEEDDIRACLLYAATIISHEEEKV
ncbi:MAG TPA: DUF433 domain-containing protein [Hanamia sp.]|nr:DUF433 domain-containing protein [Hanamia sp.]